ncbi:MAG: hypothetical protein LBK53_07930 [Heliobacteriaceae bacterium]|jgi:tetratricopeptide (TPR) repeat protein|nr:hypothetical protein [Heliobacteriaceae bacterium]
MSLKSAQQYEDNEQYEQAYEEYKKIYAKTPKNLSVLERLGHIAVVLKEKNEAAGYYSEILELDATNVMAYEQLMDIYADTDRYKYYVCRANLHSVEQKTEHAVSDYKKALANANEEAEIIPARFVLAALYEQLGQNTKAIDEYLKILDYENTHEDVYLKLANLYTKENIVHSAVDVLERARANGFDTANIRESLAQLYLRSGSSQAAMEITDNELTKIRAMLDSGNAAQAWELIQCAEKRYKHDKEFLALKAQYYYENKENEKALEAVAEFEKFEKNSPLTYQMRAMIYENSGDEFNAHLNWGLYNILRGSKDIAVNEFLEAYKINGSSADLINRLAMLYEETGDKHYAAEFYEKLFALEPENKTALEKLADFRESIGDYKMQEEYLEKLHKLDPRNAEISAKLEKFRAKKSDTSAEEVEGLIDKIMKLFNK